MLRVGDKFPEFSVPATVSSDFSKAFSNVSNETYKGKWVVLFFWPKDFTFVCPTEIQGFNDLYDDFKGRNAQLLGASTDSEFVHFAWRKYELTDIKFPMLADVKRELSSALGIIDDEHGVAQRATYIIDPEGKTRFVMVTDINVGRNPTEVLRVLDALQTDELCPCKWEKGESTLKIS